MNAMQPANSNDEKSIAMKHHKPSDHSFWGRKRRFSGFSLIELLVVLSIIALLLSIGTAVALRMVKEARVEATRAMLNGLLGANEEFKAVRKEGPINHEGSYPIDWTTSEGNKLSSSERFVRGCSQIQSSTDMMMAAINSGSSSALEIVYNDKDNDGTFQIFDRWRTEVEYRSRNNSKGAGPSTGVSNSLLPVTNYPFFVSAGPDQQFGTDDDITTVAD